MAADALIQVAQNLWTNFIAFLPNLVATIILFAVGYVVGRALGRVAFEVLTRFGIDRELKKEAHIKVSVSHAMDLVVRWVIYLVFIQAGVNVLGINALSLFVGSVIGFLPQVVAAGIVMLVAYAIGIYFKEHIIASKTLYANITGKVIFFLILYLGLSVALRIIRIPLDIVDQILLILVGSVGLGLAIALGLGLKDVVNEVAREGLAAYKSKKR